MVLVAVVIYVSCVLYILAVHFDDLGHYLALIVTDAFKGEYFNPEAAGGGAIGALIVHGTKRAAFSNEPYRNCNTSSWCRKNERTRA